MKFLLIFSTVKGEAGKTRFFCRVEIGSVKGRVLLILPKRHQIASNLISSMRIFCQSLFRVKKMEQLKVSFDAI
jgi:hypothetical protein